MQNQLGLCNYLKKLIFLMNFQREWILNMKESFFLAFDLGASSGRAILGKLSSDRWVIQEVHRFQNMPQQTADGLVWDYLHLQQELKTGLRRALALVSVLDGIGIDTWGVDYVLFDRKTGAPKRMPYHYRDSRTIAAEAKVRDLVSLDELYGRTGIQYMRINTLYQLVAHHQQHPEDFVDSFFLMIPDALALSLGGDLQSEYTDCSTTNLLNLQSRQWDWELIDRLELPRSIFPPIVAPGTAGGVLSEALQRELKCGPIPIWKIGSHDTASAVAAVPFDDSGDTAAYISAGTWALLGTELAEPFSGAAAQAGNFTNEGGLSGTIRFLTNIMGSWLFQEIRRAWQAEGIERSFAEMENLAKTVPSCRFLLNPNDSAFVEPGGMPNRIREYCKKTNQGETLSDAELLRAVYDSLALCFCSKLTQMEQILGRNFPCLNVVGGGTKDRLLMQLTADALGRPVLAGPVEATAIGNLLGQALAAGMLKDLKQMRQTVKNSFPVERFESRPAENEQYRRAAERFAFL